jgi:hypothetical protein
MSTMIPTAAALLFFYAAVALLGAPGTQAAVVEHTFVVSRNACLLLGQPRYVFHFQRLIPK